MATQENQAEASPEEDSSARVLIIDDEPAVRESIEDSLLGGRYKVFTADNGEEGVKRYRECDPDVVILDLRMPIMDGYGFLEAVSNNGDGDGDGHEDDFRSIIVLTGHGGRDDIRTCFRLGINAFLRKPFNIYELNGLVQNAVALRRLGRSLVNANISLSETLDHRTQALERESIQRRDEQQKRERIEWEMVERLERWATLGTLASMTAHEINNPLAYLSLNVANLRGAVATMAAALTDGRSGDEKISVNVDGTSYNMSPVRAKATADEAIGSTVKAAGTIRQIVDELRRYGRPQDAPTTEVDLKKVCEDAIELLRPQLRDISVSIDVDANLPFVVARPLKIEQALVNLLRNASDALHRYRDQEKDASDSANAVTATAPSALTITIKMYAKGDNAKIEVTDNGPGIAPKIADKLFKTYISDKPADRGTGLGMMITQAAIEAHNGHIGFETKIGSGTTFTITLPLKN